MKRKNVKENIIHKKGKYISLSDEEVKTRNVCKSKIAISKEVVVVCPNNDSIQESRDEEDSHGNISDVCFTSDNSISSSDDSQLTDLGVPSDIQIIPIELNLGKKNGF